MSGKLRALGKATSAILEALIAPQIGRPELAAAVGYTENAGAPTSVTPDFIGQWLFDTSSGDFYRAYGTSSGNWTLVGVPELSAANLATLDSLANIGATAAEIDMAADSSANTEIVTAANVITAEESGKTFILNSATTILSTLPAVAVGLRFKFIVGALGVANGQNHAIVPNAANDNTIFGGAIVAGSEVAASAEGSINIVGTSGTTALPGDVVEVFCDGTNWYANGRATTAGAITFTT